jgi:hypothetical protein
MAQPGANPQGGPPSPWQSRYQFNPNQTHSGLSPIAPEINGGIPYGLGIGPETYANQGAVPKPSGDVLDELFSWERVQVQALSGIRSWHLASLNSKTEQSDLWPTSWNHEDWKRQESQWHCIFRKCNWYNYNALIDPNDASKGIWSVDNAEVWREMRCVIDLANRLFKALLETDWCVSCDSSPRFLSDTLLTFLGFVA